MRHLIESDVSAALAITAVAMAAMFVLSFFGLDVLVAGAIALLGEFALIGYRRALLVRYEARDMAKESSRHE